MSQSLAEPAQESKVRLNVNKVKPISVTNLCVGEIGNGRACAILLARQGAKVALFDFNEQWAYDTKEMIDAEGGSSEVVTVDVTSEESVKQAVQRTFDLYGRIDILVNIGVYLSADTSPA